MPSSSGKVNVIIIDKSGTPKLSDATTLQFSELYKKCNFKTSDGFERRQSWKVDDNMYIELWARDEGRAGHENKYEFPPPVDSVLYFGSCAIVAVSSSNLTSVKRRIINLTLEKWKEIYEGLYGGFDEVDDDDDEDDEEDVDDDMMTKNGYMKDGFVVDDSDCESDYDDDDGDQDGEDDEDEDEDDDEDEDHDEEEEEEEDEEENEEEDEDEEDNVNDTKRHKRSTSSRKGGCKKQKGVGDMLDCSKRKGRTQCTIGTSGTCGDCSGGGSGVNIGSGGGNSVSSGGVNSGHTTKRARGGKGKDAYDECNGNNVVSSEVKKGRPVSKRKDAGSGSSAGGGRRRGGTTASGTVANVYDSANVVEQSELSEEEYLGSDSE